MKLENILAFFYPPICSICGCITKDMLCPKCEVKLKKELKVHIQKIEKNYFNYHIYLFLYQGSIRNYLISYKFQDKSYLSEVFVKILLKNKKICRFFKSYDIIIPVPIHKRRMRERGYNQSELIAKKIAQNMQNLELITNGLIKVKNTKPQSSLSKEQRNKNLKNAYILQNEQKIKNSNIILLDDIYTTGNTVKECSKLLKEAGAKKITVFTIAKD